MGDLIRQLKLLIICAGGVFLLLVGAYVLEHPSVRVPLVAVSVGTTVLLVALRYVLHKVHRTHWFPRIGALIGTVSIAWVVSLSGGFASDFWPAFLLVTCGTVALLSHTEAVVLYILTALALVVTQTVPLHGWRAYDLALLVTRLCVVLVPAMVLRRVYLLKEQHQVELRRAAEREEKASRDLSRRNVELNLLNNVAGALNSTLDLDHVLTRVIEMMNASLGIQVGSVSLLDEESGDLIIRTLVGEGAASVDGMHIPRGHGIAGWVCEHGETALVHDAQHDPRFYIRIDEISGFTTRSVLCIPLVSRDRIIGVIEAVNKMQGRFNQEDQQLLEGLATIAAPAIENALLHTQLKDVNDMLVQRYTELQETQDQLVAVEKRAAAMELAGAAAHQLNQPLTVILCSLGMIRRALPPDQEVLDDLDVIEEAAERATEIVNKIGSITEYRTKTYIEGIQILDLSESNGSDQDTPVADAEEVEAQSDE